MIKENVLIVHNHYQTHGGEDIVVANEKKLLENNGHKVILYSRDNSDIKNFSVFRKLLLPFVTIFNVKTYWDIKHIIKEENIDVIHVHNTFNLVSPSVYYAALNSKVPVVQTIHNFRLLCPGATFYRDGRICEDCVRYGLHCAVRHRCYRDSRIQTLVCVLNLLIHRATGIYKKIHYICLTEFNKKKIMQLEQINSFQVHVKPNFVERSIPIIPVEKRLDQFVFSGRLDKEKGIEILFRAWKLMGNTAPKLLVYGTGSMEKWCLEFIEKYKIKSIEMRGFVPNEEVRKVIAASKATILPTQLYEGLPMSIIESYATCTPVLVSNLGNAGDIVTEGVSGSKFIPDSPENIIQAIQNLNGYEDIVTSIDMEYKSKYTEKENYRCLVNIYQII